VSAAGLCRLAAGLITVKRARVEPFHSCQEQIDHIAKGCGTLRRTHKVHFPSLDLPSPNLSCTDHFRSSSLSIIALTA